MTQLEFPDKFILDSIFERCPSSPSGAELPAARAVDAKPARAEVHF